MSQIYTFTKSGRASIPSQVFSLVQSDDYGYEQLNRFGYYDNKNYGYLAKNNGILGLHKVLVNRTLEDGESIKLVYKNGKQLVICKEDGEFNVLESTSGTYDELGNEEYGYSSTTKRFNKILIVGETVYFGDSNENLYKLKKVSDTEFTLTGSNGAVECSVVEGETTTTVTIPNSEIRKEKSYLTFFRTPDRHGHETSRRFWSLIHRRNA